MGCNITCDCNPGPERYRAERSQTISFTDSPTKTTFHARDYYGIPTIEFNDTPPKRPKAIELQEPMSLDAEEN